MNATKVKMIAGSEGNMDYMVLAQNKNHVLAVKAIVQCVPQYGAFVGGRLRACAAHNPGEMKEVSVGESLEEFSKGDFGSSFPGMTFSLVNLSRGSVIVGLLIPRAPWQTDELKQALHTTRVGLKIIGYVRDRVPEDLVLVDPEAAANHLFTQWSTLIDVAVDEVFMSHNDFIDSSAEVAPVEEIKAGLAKQTKKTGLKIVAKNDLDDDPLNAA